MTEKAFHPDRRPSDDRSVTAAARRLESTLTGDVGEAVVGIASYENDQYDVAYRDDTVSSRYTDTDVRAIMENIQLDGIGAPAYEDHHGQELHATVRVYDTLVTVAVPVTTTAGLVVVLRNDGSHDPYSVIETVENAAR